MRLLAVFFALVLLSNCSGARHRPLDEVGRRLEGPVTDVRLEEGAVVSFDLETDGPSARIHIDPQRDYGFDLTHLEEHEKTREPVNVTTELRDGRLYAISIEDA